jgi:hypothetical protein
MLPLTGIGIKPFIITEHWVDPSNYGLIDVPHLPAVFVVLLTKVLIMVLATATLSPGTL